MCPSLPRTVLSFVLAAMFCFGMSQPGAGQQSASTTQAGSPLKMHLCVDNVCETLIWRGSYYDGIKDKGSDITNHYKVDEWSKSGIKLEGKSISPMFVNAPPIPIPIRTYLEGVFTGPIAADGHGIDNGVVHWKLGPQHGEKVFTLTWDADAPAAAAIPTCSEGISNLPSPSALEVCDGSCVLKNDRNLGAWLFHGSKGSGAWQQGGKAELTIEEWSNGTVKIEREDLPSSTTAGLSAVYQGVVCGGTVKGTVVFRWPGHFNDKDFSAPWTATIPITSCDGVEDDTLALMDIAKTAVRFRQPPSAFKCLSRAAELGDRDARTAIGLMYRDGIGTKVSYPDAIRYLKQSAIQEDYNAQLALSQIYDIGLGVPADASQAKQWQARAYNNPVAVANRQNLQNAKEMREMTFLGLSALVEAMATPSVYVVH